MNTEQYTIAEQLKMQRGCPFCRSVPATNNPAMCLCSFDCHRELCGRVGSGEAERQGDDVERGDEPDEYPPDHPETRRAIWLRYSIAENKRARAAAFDIEIREIIEEQKNERRRTG